MSSDREVLQCPCAVGKGPDNLGRNMFGSECRRGFYNCEIPVQVIFVVSCTIQLLGGQYFGNVCTCLIQIEWARNLPHLSSY